jgi:hypothetical protein
VQFMLGVINRSSPIDTNRSMPATGSEQMGSQKATDTNHSSFSFGGSSSSPSAQSANDSSMSDQGAGQSSDTQGSLREKLMQLLQTLMKALGEEGNTPSSEAKSNPSSGSGAGSGGAAPNALKAAGSGAGADAGKGAGGSAKPNGSAGGADGKPDSGKPGNGNTDSASATKDAKGAAGTAATGATTAPGGNSKIDKEKDLVEMHYDLKPDVDDAHSAAAGATLLEKSGVKNFHAVRGTVGNQGGQMLSGTDGLFNKGFGTQWSDAKDSDAVTKAADRWEKTIKGGGKVHVMEGGQSNFTSSVIDEMKSRGVDTKANVSVKQHSNWNEQQTSGDALKNVQANTNYQKISDGNRAGFVTKDNNEAQDFFAKAKESTKGGAWSEANQLYTANNGKGYNNPHKIDFSDTWELANSLGVDFKKVGDLFAS